MKGTVGRDEKKEAWRVAERNSSHVPRDRQQSVFAEERDELIGRADKCDQIDERERSLKDVGEVAAIEDDGHARAGGANAIGHLLAPNEIPPAHLGWVQPELGGKQVERALAHEANLEEARTP